MDIPYEFCALRFLIQWERSEKALSSAMQHAPTIDAIRKSLKYFQVARNFPGLKEDSQTKIILKAIASVDAKQQLTFDEKVDRLAHLFLRDFGQFNLSAASKLFWLKHRSPYIIFDSRAVNALKGFGHKLNKRSYAEYCDAWRKEYKTRHSDLKAASSRLIQMRSFLPAWHVDAKEMSATISDPWFIERVFDIYLWEVGGEG